MRSTSSRGSEERRSSFPREYHSPVLQPDIVLPVSSSDLMSLRIQSHPPPPSVLKLDLVAAIHHRRARRVVRDGETAEAARGLLDLERDARESFLPVFLVEQEAIGLHELERRLHLDDLAVDDDFGQSEGPHLLVGDAAEFSARLELVVADAAIAVLPVPFRTGDGVPDLTRLRLDVDLVDVGGRIQFRLQARLRNGGHLAFSKVVLRSASADSSRSLYLSIQRS